MKKHVLLAAFAWSGLMGCERASDKIVNDNPGSNSTNAAQVKAPNPVPASPMNNNAPQETDMGVVDGAAGAPAFSFAQENHDFGTIAQGDKPQTTFTFTNTGDAPLIISNAQGSCGCTVPDWPRNPIAPGEQGEIKVSFNSSGRQGKNDKQVTLNANTIPNTRVLKITSSVLPNPNKANTAQ